MGDFEVLPSASNKMLSLIITPAELVQLGVCDERNSMQVARFIVAWIGLLEDSPLVSTQGSKPRRLVRKFLADVLSRPILDTVLRYAALGDALVSSPVDLPHGSEKGPWIDFNDTPIFKEYHEWHRTGNALVFKFVLSFLWFGKKMQYENEDFYTTALRRWKGVEEKLASLVLPDVTSHLADIIKECLGPLAKVPLGPKFGPGYVSERGVHGIIDKTDIAYDAKLDRVFFQANVFVTDAEREHMGYHPDRSLPSTASWDPEVIESIKQSRLKFVPKNVKTARSICMEPNAYMYMQQAVLQRVTISIDESVFGRFIRLRDQSRNQYLAEYGSLTNRIDTLDMSDASDSVSVELVRRVFPRDWLYFLLGTRTSSVILPDKSVVQVKKFAPMGSALCFPTQCIIFTGVCLQAAMYNLFGQERVEKEGVKALLPAVLTAIGDKPNLTSGLMPLAVYGDDLCVDSKLTPIITELLAGYGFSVNLDKSFTGNQSFRESCGEYYLGGSNVTPIFYKLPMFKEELSAADIFAIIGQCNYAFDTYKAYRKYLLRLLRERVPAIRFTHDEQDTSAVRSNREQLNLHLKRRWNKYLQRDEVRHVRIGVQDFERPEAGELEAVEKYLYIQWHRAAFRGDDAGDYKPPALRGVAANYRVVWGWTPDYT